MKTDYLFFAPVKEHRGKYFIEYRPPISGYRFATLQLVFLNNVEQQHVAALMESELDIWLNRYCVPVMVSAFDNIGALISLEQMKGCDHLFGLPANNGKMPQHIWQLVKSEELPGYVQDSQFLKETYADIPYKTSDQLSVESQRKYKKLKTGWTLFSMWQVIVPIAVAIFGFLTSQWIAVGILVLIYSLCQAIDKGVKIFSRREYWWERQLAEKEARMRHYSYHCELNPEGFRRLEIENFEKDLKNEIKNEAEMLKQYGNSKNGEP
jgi:hypothetical protein